MRGLYCIYFVLLLMFNLISCTSDNGITENDLAKKWVVVNAARNGAETQTLNGAYFNFSHDSLISNFIGRHSAYTYELLGNAIELSPNQAKFQIQYLSTDSLHLSAKIMQFPFDFYLNPASPQSE